MRLFAAAALAAAAAGWAGCGPAGPTTYPVSGKVVPKNGDLKPFVGKMVEFQSVADPTTRAYGEVQPDGSFTLTTVAAGVTHKGAVAGAHKGRFPMELNEDDDGRPRKKGRGPVDLRYARFETAGWEIEVPVAGDVVLTVN